jgi:hypothetical protein
MRLQGDRALVEFFDCDATVDVDVSMVDATKDAYVEVFGGCAVGRLTRREAEARKKVWSELRELGSGRAEDGQSAREHPRDTQ